MYSMCVHEHALCLNLAIHCTVIIMLLAKDIVWWYDHQSTTLSLTVGIISQEVESVSLRVMEQSESERAASSHLREERAIRSSGRWANATIPFYFDTNTLSKFFDQFSHPDTK